MAWDAIRHRVRNRLLKVPAAAAARVAVCTRVGEVQALLRDVVYGALLELSSWELVDTSVLPPVADPRLSSNASALEAETAKVTAQGSLRALKVEIVAGRMISIDDADDSLGRVLEVVRQCMLHIEGTIPPRLIARSVKQIETAL